MHVVLRFGQLALRLCHTIARRLWIAAAQRVLGVTQLLSNLRVGDDGQCRAISGGTCLDDPVSQAELADSLSIATLRLLESLSPEQRATLLLHDVFDYRYGEIAEIIGKSEANVRKLGTRARRHVEESRPRFQTSQQQRDELARRFFAAAREGDLDELEALLAADVTLTGDGGGKVPSLPRMIRGRSRVAKTLRNWLRFRRRVGEGSIREVQINGAPGALLLDADGLLFGVWSLEIVGGEIMSLSSIVNPEKLAHIGPPADFAGMLRKAREPN